jgi:hypothetical protein
MWQLTERDVREVSGGLAANSGGPNGLIIVPVGGDNDLLLQGSQTTTPVIVNGAAESQVTESINVSSNAYGQVGKIVLSAVSGSSNQYESFSSPNEEYSFIENRSGSGFYQVKIVDNNSEAAVCYVTIYTTGFTAITDP